jgi:hypothetical protein
MATLVASRHNPILKPLYQRLLAAGKPKKLALTVLMRKLILLANRILKIPLFPLQPKTVADPLYLFRKTTARCTF